MWNLRRMGKSERRAGAVSGNAEWRNLWNKLDTEKKLNFLPVSFSVCFCPHFLSVSFLVHAKDGKGAVP